MRINEPIFVFLIITFFCFLIKIHEIFEKDFNKEISFNDFFNISLASFIHGIIGLLCWLSLEEIGFKFQIYGNEVEVKSWTNILISGFIPFFYTEIVRKIKKILEKE